jgi:Ca2+-binding RTX toxin-like protein
MHGRSLLLAATALLAACAATATPAFADETLALGQPAAVDGVVTSWQVQSATGQNLRLRSTQALQSSTATTATTDPATISASPQTLSARLPIAAGGALALVGASGSPTVAATVEPDRDGDGYGDTTQDACADDATAHLAPCGATDTIGSPLTLQPDPRGFSGSGNPLQALQRSAAGTISGPTAAGVLVRWRLRAVPAKGDTVLQLLRPTTPAATTFTVVAESIPVHVTSTDVVTVPASIAVQAGDRLAARSVSSGSNSDLGAVAARAADELVAHQPPATAGQTWTPDTSSPYGFRLLVQADVEPDRNHNGKGDLSQEHADLQLTGTAPAEVLAGDAWSHSYTVRNAGPDDAYDVGVSLLGAGVLGATPGAPVCAPLGGTGPGVWCDLGTLAAGASVTIVPGFAIPTIFPPPSGTYASTAMLASSTPDPNEGDNSAALRTFVRATGAGVTPPPPPPPPGLCANVVRGTRDDDVVRGTAFGDRLVGGDGDDLLKALGGDDCLEGGTGDDVLDGGDGNDRLAGSSGRDRLSGGTGDDKLTGGKGNDRLTGGPGKDTISPGAGHDVVDAGSGDDSINAVDGVKETIDCGAGKDTVRADRRDRLKHCEKITRRN